MVCRYSNVPAPPYGLWLPPVHSYLHGETVRLSSASRNRHGQQTAPADGCYSAACGEMGSNIPKENPCKTERCGSFVGRAAAASSRQQELTKTMRFLGKSKDVALATSRRRNQLWAQGSFPSLGFYSPIPHVKKCFLESKKRL